MNTDLIKKAYYFAREKHKGQKRDNGDEYIVHPIRVAKIVITFKDTHDIDVLIASSLLHDTLEDTYTSYKELVDNFGEVIASIVEELTTAGYVPKLEGKEMYLSKKMQNMTNYALVIKLADRLDNVSDLNTTTEEKKNRVIAQTQYIVNYLKINRELTPTQQKLIKEIEKKLEEY